MPRVANNGDTVRIWYREEADGNGTSTHDICADCAEDPETARESLEPYNGDPRGDELDEGCPHPCYEEMYQTGEDYRCEICNKILREVDNGEAY
jgi:hypothetical protein